MSNTLKEMKSELPLYNNARKMQRLLQRERDQIKKKNLLWKVVRGRISHILEVKQSVVICKKSPVAFVA